MWNDILINIFEDGFFAAIAAIGFSSISNTPPMCISDLGPDCRRRPCNTICADAA